MSHAQDARRWHQRAEECRTAAESMSSQLGRAAMLHCAETYDGMAAAAERRDGRKDPEMD
jgi:hypothetical protein